MPESFGVGAVVQAAFLGLVDGADPPRERLGERHEQPGDRGGGHKGEECVDGLAAMA